MKSFVVFCLMFNLVFVSAQKKVGGVKIPTSFEIAGHNLVLNGAGVREKLYLDLFVIALYLKEKSTDPHKIMRANEPMAIKLHILSSFITSERMEDSADEGFIRSTEGHTEPIMNKINQFKSVFTEKVHKGDVFDFAFDPEKGTHVYKNGILSTVIQGLDFKQALFGLWLFKKPTDSDIQDKLMGK